MGNLLNKTQQSQAFYYSLIVVGVFAFLINLITILMFIRFRDKLLQLSHNCILCSVAVADAFVGCFGISLGVSLLNKSPRIVYKLAGNIPLFSSMFISIGSLCLLTADRLIAIKKPLLYGSSFYRRSIKRGIAAVWAISLLISLQQSLIWVYVSSNMELKIRSIFLSVFFCAGAIVLFVSNVVLFAGIKNYISRVEQRTKSVFGDITISAAMASQTENQVKFSAVVPDRKNSALKINENEEPGSSKTRQPNVPCAENRLSLNSTTDVLPRIIAKADFKRRVRLTRKRELRRTSMLCILIVALFILSWLPLSCYRMAYVIIGKVSIAWLRRFSLCLAISNSIVNPLIYFFLKVEYRRYLIRLITCK